MNEKVYSASANSRALKSATDGSCIIVFTIIIIFSFFYQSKISLQERWIADEMLYSILYDFAQKRKNVLHDAHVIITLNDRDDSTTRIAFYYITRVSSFTVYNVGTWYFHFMRVVALILQLTLFIGIIGIIIYYFPARITV